jgi:hypothetical protein
MSTPWTIDAIAHALPHPDARQNFLREVNLTPLPELPGVLARWERVAAEWTEAAPRLEQLRAYTVEHGHLPPEYEAGLVEMSIDDLRADAGIAQDAAA